MEGKLPNVFSSSVVEHVGINFWVQLGGGMTLHYLVNLRRVFLATELKRGK